MSSFFPFSIHGSDLRADEILLWVVGSRKVEDSRVRGDFLLGYPELQYFFSFI